MLVTGANSGIGMEACKQLYEAGCRVLVAARSAEKAEEAMRRIAREGAGGAGLLNPWCLIYLDWTLSATWPIPSFQQA